jgi:hypothetical protein
MFSRAIRNRCTEIVLISDENVAASRQWRHRYTDDDLIRLTVTLSLLSLRLRC